MKYFEMFTGIAGFSKGIEQAYEDVHGSEQGQELRPESVQDSGMSASGESGQSAIGGNNSGCNGGGQSECLDLSASDSQRSPECLAASSDTTTPTSETTETPASSTPTTLPDISTQQELFPTSCRTSTFSAADFLARVGQLLESDKDLMTPEALCFLRSHGFYHTKDPDIFYSKTLKVCLVLTGAKLSRKYLGFSPNSVTAWKQLFLTQSTTAFPRTGSECFLSGILESDVAEKYFLSGKATERLFRRDMSSVYLEHSQQKIKVGKLTGTDQQPLSEQM